MRQRSKIIKDQHGVTIYLTNDWFERFTKECKWTVELACNHNSLYQVSKSLPVITSIMLSEKAVSKMDLGDRVILTNKLDNWYEYEG
jgi:predicted transcriptional regulator